MVPDRERPRGKPEDPANVPVSRVQHAVPTEVVPEPPHQVPVWQGSTVPVPAVPEAVPPEGEPRESHHQRVRKGEPVPVFGV